jgi:hypothetical protein
MSVTNQQGSIKKMPTLKLKIKAVCIRFSNLVVLNTDSSQVRIAVCKCLFRNLSDLNFNMNNRLKENIFVYSPCLCFIVWLKQ